MKNNTFGPERPVGPMRPWPRPNGPEVIDGPLRLATGPRDHEGLGRERFWDQTPEERREALKAMVTDANVNVAAASMRYVGVISENKAFAKGWLNELDRARAYGPKDVSS